MLAVTLALALTGSSYSDDTLSKQVKEAIKKATVYFHSISTNGGYVGIYSLDLKKRYGEALYEKAMATEIWVQPPGTPSIGQCFLRAYKITDDREFLAAARDAGRALAWGQRQEGGWDHRVDVAHLRPGSLKPERKSGRCTLDDNISQGALSFLIDVDEVIDEEWLTESIELALNFMMESHSPHTLAAFTTGSVDRNTNKRKIGLSRISVRTRILPIQPSLQKGLSLWIGVPLSRYLKLLTEAP